MPALFATAPENGRSFENQAENITTGQSLCFVHPDDSAPRFLLHQSVDLDELVLFLNF
jgi:hypothetical protein